MNAAELRMDLQKVSSMVSTARRLLAGGTMVDLSALQGQVTGLCQSVAGLPLDEGRTLQPGLESLMRGLDGLTKDLDHLHDQMTGGRDPDAPR